MISCKCRRIPLVHIPDVAFSDCSVASGEEIDTNKNTGFLSYIYLLFLLFHISQAICQCAAGTTVPLNQQIHFFPVSSYE